MKHTRFKIGDNNVISDISGFKYNASECVYGVDQEAGLIMHWTEFSPHNPQYNITGKKENRLVEKVRTVQPYDFITTPVTPGDL